MEKTYKRILLVSIIGLVLWMLFPVKTIRMTDGEGRRIISHPVVEGTKLIYQSIHSVSMTPLEETILIKGDGFEAVKVRFKDQSGAGLPEYTYDQGNFYTEDGWMVIDGMSRGFERLSFRIEGQYYNRLTIDGSQILLYDLFPEGKGEVNLSVGFTPRIMLRTAKEILEDTNER